MAAERESAHHGHQPRADVVDEERLKEAASAAEKALAAQNTANSLKAAAKCLTDPKARERILQDAYNKEVEAHGNSKKARMLQSGAFQGTVGGAGIGGAVGLGVGTVVGTVVGGLTAIPTTGLGALVGSGVGAIHGPFIKLGSLATGGNKDANTGGSKEDAKEPQQGSPEDDDAVPDPKVLRQAADLLAEEREKQGLGAGAPNKDATSQTKQRKKPRKLEIRSANQPDKMQ